MSRIQRAFERRFRELLAELGARQRQRGVHWLFSHAQHHARPGQSNLSQSLAAENIRLAAKVNQFRHRRGLRPPSGPPRLFCDAGLGGLARWLRAAGCDAGWVQDISDADLVRLASAAGATIITTDSLLLERRPIAYGQVSALWVPPSLTPFEQLQLVRAELDLPELEPRCMRCGGALLRVGKEAVRDRIPPKTYLWIDEYYQCARCGQLFWHGTHWARVAQQLLAARAGSGG